MHRTVKVTVNFYNIKPFFYKIGHLEDIHSISFNLKFFFQMTLILFFLAKVFLTIKNISNTNQKIHKDVLSTKSEENTCNPYR